MYQSLNQLMNWKNPNLSQKMGFPDKSIIISCFRRLVEKNGVIYLIETANKIIKDYPNLYFNIIGDGPQKKLIVSKVSHELKR